MEDTHFKKETQMNFPEMKTTIRWKNTLGINFRVDEGENSELEDIAVKTV